MEESQYLMWMKSKQVVKAHLEAPFGDGNSYSSWEERAFAEDAARILGGSTWPPRSYSCTFCKREFRSAQALGGHMNVHRRDRARLKQNLSPHKEALDHHHKNYHCKSLGTHQFSAEISSQLDCCLNPYSRTHATMTSTRRHSPSRLSSMSTGENCGQHAITPYSSSVTWGQKNGSPNSEPLGGPINAREDNFKGLGCNDSVETSLSVGLSSMFGQKSPTVPCGDEAIISCKRLKTTISSLPVCLKPCSNDRRVAFQSAEIVLGLNPGMEDLDLELRLGKQQKVK